MHKGKILLFIFLLLGIYIFVSSLRNPKPKLLQEIPIPNMTNTYFRVYEVVHILDDKWCLYYEVVENEEIVCKMDYLSYVHINSEPFEFRVDNINGYAYIVTCAYNKIDAIYDSHQKKCVSITPSNIDSLFQSVPFKEIGHKEWYCPK